MADETINCSECGTAIPVEEFEGGRALEIRGSYFCRGCKADVVQAEHDADSPPPGEAKRVRHYLIGAAAAVIVIIVAALILFPRGGGEAPGAAEGAEEAVSDEDLESDRRVLKEMETYIRDHPENIYGIRREAARAERWIESETVRAELRAIAEEGEAAARGRLDARAREAIEKATGLVGSGEYDGAREALRAMPEELRGSDLWKEADRIRERAEALRDREAAAEAAVARVTGLLEEGKYEEAAGALDGVDLEGLEETSLADRVRTLKERIAEEKVQAEADALKREAFEALQASAEEQIAPGVGEYEGAIEDVEKRLTEFEGTVYEEKARGLIERVRETFREEVRGIAATGGEPLIGTNLFYWKIREGQTGKWELDKKKKILKGRTMGGALIGYQYDKWIDYLVDFEAKVFFGKLTLCVHIGLAEDGAAEYTAVPVKGTSRAWKTFRFLVRRGRIYEVDPETFEMREVSILHVGSSRDKGAIGFLIEGTADVEIRSATLRPIPEQG